jgi:hypothetical protein
MDAFGRFLAIAGLTLAVAVYSPAQTPVSNRKAPSSKTIDGWLSSDNPRLVAWGAYNVLLTRNRHFTPQLLLLASQWQPIFSESDDVRNKPPSQEQRDQRDAMAAVVDALVQMGVPVPADTLRALAPDFGNAVAILLSRMPPDESEPLALDFYHTTSHHEYGLQYTSAALLALRPPAGFAADLLKSITVHVNVYVYLPGEDHGGHGFAGDCFREESVARKDWPRAIHYQLSKETKDGAAPIVRGIDPVYATREPGATYIADSCPELYLGPYDRQRLIAGMLGIDPESMPWHTDSETTIEFISREQFDLELHRFIDEQEKKYQTTAAELADRGFINPLEAEQTTPKLTLAINDMRGSSAEDNPITKIADLPSNVELCCSLK